MESHATRRQHSDAALHRLRRIVIIGVSIAGCVLGLGGTIVGVSGAVDPNFALTFLPDAFVGAAALWCVLRRRRVDTAIQIYAWFYVVNFGFFALHADGYRIFASTTYVVVPPIFGYYLGGRRLGTQLTAALVVEALTSVIVHHLGVGHRLVVIPPGDHPTTVALMAIGVCWVVVLVNVFERSRSRTHAGLDQVLGELDEQSATVLSVIESQRDVVLLLDKDHQVVVHNHAAATAFPSLVAGGGFFAVVAADRARHWEEWFGEAAVVGHARAEEQMATPSGVRHFEISFSRVAAGDRLVGFTLVARDLSERRAADAALRRMRGQLLDASRRAGRADVAAALMHNLGNTLNGASVSIAQLGDRARGLRLEGLRRAAALLRERADADPRLIAFLDGTSELLERERAAMIEAASALHDQIAQVGAVVSTFEDQARVREVFEEVDLDEVVDSALEADDDRWRALGLERALQPTGTIVTIRQKLLDVVIAMLGQAHTRPRIALHPIDGDRIALVITDRGASLDAGQVVALLGHGAALHGAALAASGLGGSLRHQREPDGGNRFVLELPRVNRVAAQAA